MSYNNNKKNNPGDYWIQIFFKQLLHYEVSIWSQEHRKSGSGNHFHFRLEDTGEMMITDNGISRKHITHLLFHIFGFLLTIWGLYIALSLG